MSAPLLVRFFYIVIQENHRKMLRIFRWFSNTLLIIRKLIHSYHPQQTVFQDFELHCTYYFPQNQYLQE